VCVCVRVCACVCVCVCVCACACACRIDLSSLQQGLMVDFREHGNEPLGSTRDVDFLTERPSLSKQKLSSTELLLLITNTSSNIMLIRKILEAEGVQVSFHCPISLKRLYKNMAVNEVWVTVVMILRHYLNVHFHELKTITTKITNQKN
jgi:hypothetical protein